MSMTSVDPTRLLTDDMLVRFDERAATYDRENRFFDEDWAELRDSGLRAMSEAVATMDIRAEHVIFGHTHRPWPVEGRDQDWRTPSGALLHNTGSWYHEGSLIADAGPSSPYWPGWVTWLDETGPPRLENLLRGWAP